MKYYTTKGKLPKGSTSKIMAEFNQHFASVPSFKVTYATAAKRFPAIIMSKVQEEVDIQYSPQ